MTFYTPQSITTNGQETNPINTMMVTETNPIKRWLHETKPEWQPGWPDMPGSASSMIGQSLGAESGYQSHKTVEVWMPTATAREYDAIFDPPNLIR
jgi:hypothetical protein